MENAHFRKQLLIITGIFLLIIVGKLFQLQIIKGKRYFRLAEANRIRKVYTPAPRGKIYDREGKLLADSRPSFAISVIPCEMDSNTINNLTHFANLDQIRIKEWINNVAYQRTPLKVKRNIDMNVVLKLEENSASLRGVSVEVEPIRIYPNGVANAHVIGYLSEISPSEVKTDTYYKPWHYIGRYGIEAEYEKFLRGKDGIRYTEIDASGREIGLIKEKREVLPESGNDVYLTIDAEIQNLAYELVNKYNRAAVVGIEIKTGEIICLVSHPGFNPELITQGISSSEWQKLLADKSSPMMNRAISSTYPPGSTIKPFIALAALESNIVNPQTRFVPCIGTFTYGNRNYKCLAKHGSLNLQDAIVYSCNIYFYQLGLKLGLNQMTSFLINWGFNNKTDIDLSNERRGNVPTQEWLDKRYGKNRWTRGILPNLAIGQGEILVTPLQLATFYAAIAGNGEYYTPHILKAVKNHDQIIKANQPQKKKLSVSAKNIEYIKQALTDAVSEGTGGAAYLGHVEVAGKTGTAENPPRSDHAWFVGYAPSNNPEVVFCVIVENIGKGGQISAPIVRELIRKYFTLPKKSEDK